MGLGEVLAVFLGRDDDFDLPAAVEDRFREPRVGPSAMQLTPIRSVGWYCSITVVSAARTSRAAWSGSPRWPVMPNRTLTCPYVRR